jgi:thioredoxin reductase
MQTIRKYDVLIIGAGPSGIGTAITLMEFGVKNILVVDKESIGASFLLWPKETRLITPSFTGHQFGGLDLNAITYATSPAYTLSTEHPSGREYQRYLLECAKEFKVPFKKETILSIKKESEYFECSTQDGMIHATYVVTAIGEFNFPNTEPFEGAELCRHTATISSYDAITGDVIYIIGGYESGTDAAIHLSKNKKHITIFDTNNPWDRRESDPSVTLSPFTLDRLREEMRAGSINLSPQEKVIRVTLDQGVYTIETNRESYTTITQPILASGFISVPPLIKNIFNSQHGIPLISDIDESTIVPNAFLVGPKVFHSNVIFCFIYKYRQRFGIVANAIATRMGIQTSASVEFYRNKTMYLDDLSCCNDACVC